MLILAVDTCCGPFSIAIKRDEHLLAHIVENQENKQAELLILTVEEALSKAGISYTDLELIAVTKGPGSFTGIRAGLASVYAISSVLNIPCIGVTTLEVLAHQLIKTVLEDKFYITIAAGRGRYYCQLFNCFLIALSEIKLLEGEEISRLNEAIYGDYRQKTIIDTTVVANICSTKFKNRNIQLPVALYK
ncbi:MAG: tRNA (adenosine(37)-N6)-threonylcarbamoyltransferase complex dimerization subunit type 1 TsaB [Candidatus Midichloria sp.]|uniref:tRNA (Adenosine(37)-N6)-threonylcarbamoyltransferase complex dimerization subunit type 1 TsaB n=1 Tax=Hyalomma marginatum TaxID=34627 RepID=A0A8S4C296_9ACAR|nr:tRNA (adenosine(37)-N6)-threonylcarbamoyltransferase complex dimerization subunit type 1 TsaB [Hyalomma marginatum]CAG7598674.1 tRNA (adenosine(37)-N6)-threonylcarbamoyltransferase complex dimerization subunit type 1 TsaB [Hyalomma marginatum]